MSCHLIILIYIYCIHIYSRLRDIKVYTYVKRQFISVFKALFFIVVVAVNLIFFFSANLTLAIQTKITQIVNAGMMLFFLYNRAALTA